MHIYRSGSDNATMAEVSQRKLQGSGFTGEMLHHLGA